MVTGHVAAVERKPGGIKLTLTSSTKSNIEAEKRQQSKKAWLETKEHYDSNFVSGESDSD